MAVGARLTDEKKVVIEMNIKDAFEFAALIKAVRHGDKLNVYGEATAFLFDTVMDNMIERDFV